MAIKHYQGRFRIINFNFLLKKNENFHFQPSSPLVIKKVGDNSVKATYTCTFCSCWGLRRDPRRGTSSPGRSSMTTSCSSRLQTDEGFKVTPRDQQLKSARLIYLASSSSACSLDCVRRRFSTWARITSTARATRSSCCTAPYICAHHCHSIA